MGKPASQQIYVEIPVQTSLDRLWRLSQDPDLHPRWDLRFTAILPLDPQQGEGMGHGKTQRFRYEFLLPFHTIRGTGTSLGDRISADGHATSVLKFTTRDVLSPIGPGAGYWRYVPYDGGIRFITGYTYQPGWGACGKTVDGWLIRPALGWATAVSFDRLRLWAEHDVDPAAARNAWLTDAGARAAVVGLAAYLLGKTAADLLVNGRKPVSAAGSAHAAAVLAAGVLLAAARWYPASDRVPRAARCSRTATDRMSRRPPSTLAALAEPA